MNKTFEITSIGHIIRHGERTFVEINPEYEEALLGLDTFSHMAVFFWFHKNDNPQGRKVLQVHPRGDRNNPLCGVFATHSPKRPNLVGMSICRIIGIRGAVIEIERIDALDGTPVIDIKCYIPSSVKGDAVVLPDWV